MSAIEFFFVANLPPVFVDKSEVEVQHPYTAASRQLGGALHFAWLLSRRG